MIETKKLKKRKLAPQKRVVKTLFETKYVSLKSISNGDWTYFFSHENRCDGKIVSVLPFRRNELGDTEFLLRRELTPCWGTGKHISSITGGVESKSVARCALRELKEEAGYKVSLDEIIPLGTCRATKSSDSTYYLFTVDLTDKQPGKPTGDGGRMEKEEECFWAEDLDQVEDPMVFTSFYRMLKEDLI